MSDYRQPSGVSESVTILRKQPTENLTKAELRARIARPVGLNTVARTNFTLRELNSIYAYFEGEFFFPKRAYNTSASPSIKELRVQVADVAPIESYTITPEDYIGMGPFAPVRPYRQHELGQLCERVEATTDQRHE